MTDPAVDNAAHVDAVTRRRVVFLPAADGMTEMFTYLSADRAAIITATLDAMANTTIHQPGGDPRTADQRRADALIDLARVTLVHPTLVHPTPGNPAAESRRRQARHRPIPPVPPGRPHRTAKMPIPTG